MSEAKNIVEKTRILVVDDEAVVLDLMKEILSIDKYEAVLERDPRRALHRLGSEEFDIIISDFRMPAMTGKEFYNKAIEINPGFERKVRIHDRRDGPGSKKAVHTRDRSSGHIEAFPHRRDKDIHQVLPERRGQNRLIILFSSGRPDHS